MERDMTTTMTCWGVDTPHSDTWYSAIVTDGTEYAVGDSSPTAKNRMHGGASDASSREAIRLAESAWVHGPRHRGDGSDLARALADDRESAYRHGWGRGSCQRV